ncbi:MAG: hypothetical protein DRI90_04755 [Deltaproteobacteria bacterium]|nr:MAG: hypothetical protein DRI90_04755 [Deltaproteobacteria bacterium]
MRCLAALVALAAVLGAPPALADLIVIADGGTRDQLQAAIDALGGPGVVLVPPGEWECIGIVDVAADGVTILGSGSDRSRLVRATDHTDTSLRDAPFIRAVDVAGLRVGSLRIDGVSSSSSDARERGIDVRNATDFRVDHCLMSFLGFSGVVTYGTSRGVVDHCRMVDHFKPVVNNLGYGVTVFGDDSYSGLPFGTDEATFIEDSSFTGARHASASNRGARYVFRHNHVTANENSHAIDAHGDEYNGTSDAGTEWIEVYENLIDQPVHTSAAVRIRGGAGLVWNNEVQGYSNGVSLWENTPQPTGPVWVWGNTWGAGVTAIGSLSGSPEYYESAAPSYTPFTYPHPLVTDLDTQAGPDMVAAVEGGTSAEIYLDGSETSAATGAISAYRWIENADQVLSTCARDIVALEEGQHVLVLEAERGDGLTEHDTLVIDVEPAGPLSSATDWAERWFVPLVSTGTVSFSLTPVAAAQDAYVGLTGRHVVAAHGDQAIVIRTNNSGRFDAYDGDHYGEETEVAYQAGETYQVEVTFDITAQQYSVSIDGTPIATDYGFRHQESSLGQVTAWHSTGGLTVAALVRSGELAEPDPACQDAPPVGGAGGMGGSGGSSVGGAGGVLPAPGGAGQDDAGCGCALVGAPSRFATIGLVVFGLGLWRRRRRCR